MPYVWVEPEVAAEVSGLKVYHTYKDNDRRTHTFTTDPAQDDCEGEYDAPDYRLDLRNLDIRQRRRTSWNTSSGTAWYAGQTMTRRCWETRSGYGDYGFGN